MRQLSLQRTRVKTVFRFGILLWSSRILKRNPRWSMVQFHKWLMSQVTQEADATKLMAPTLLSPDFGYLSDATKLPCQCYRSVLRLNRYSQSQWKTTEIFPLVQLWRASLYYYPHKSKAVYNNFLTFLTFIKRNFFLGVFYNRLIVFYPFFLCVCVACVLDVICKFWLLNLITMQ